MTRSVTSRLYLGSRDRSIRERRIRYATVSAGSVSGCAAPPGTALGQVTCHHLLGSAVDGVPAGHPSSDRPAVIQVVLIDQGKRLVVSRPNVSGSADTLARRRGGPLPQRGAGAAPAQREPLRLTAGSPGDIQRLRISL